MCPENSYARQFKVRIEDDGSADDTALNSVRMKCFDINNEEKKYISNFNFNLSSLITDINFVPFKRKFDINTLHYQNSLHK